MSKRGAPQLNASVVTVTTAAAVEVLAARPTRRQAVLKNLDGSNYVGIDTGTAVAATGYRLKANEQVEITTTGAISGRANTGDCVCTVWEEYD